VSDWLIRPGTDEDLHATADITAAVAAEDIATGLAADSAEQLRARCGPLFFVCEAAGRIIGFANATVGESAPGERAIWPSGARFIDLTDLHVIAAERGRGIGGALLETVLEAAKGMGIERALVYSAVKDHRRITAFYERYGFRMWFVEMYR